ncbi:hypothetical protein OEZ85_011622 [Tetradesmus obliquus]|uniref:SET domain-containing protein n=1 Tax=Tetradesmus obliquus TaxID=3088 RepID=A0ABY8TRM7_TETOB|nr:hypothetical protein OEZ85_011622 [Tetradesmus obliquus]
MQFQCSISKLSKAGHASPLTLHNRHARCLQNRLNLLLWLVNNGVTGVGTEDSKVALYEDGQGDRGVIAVEDIPAGYQLLRAPLRLAITDVMEEEEQQQLVGQGALWQDRLVAKLLQQVQAGRESPWHPYLQALPKAVPSALESFSNADAAAVQLPTAVAAIRGHADKMAASWQSCRPDSIGGADLQTYRWAHSVVMSRTFGNAAQGGGIGVRMLVPLIDMLNHAGDETGGLLSEPATARDNVRWDVVSPDNSPSSCWEMVLSSTQAIPADSPLLLSYFEGGNDEFLLHYGFVPPSNPHDTVQLFSSITEALEHLWQQDIRQGQAAADLSPLYKQALDAGLAALQEELAAAADGLEGASWGPLLDALEPIKVVSGSRVSGSLIAALEVLKHGDMAAVEAAVAGLAWQQLAALDSSLLSDLALLVADAHVAGDGEAVQLFGKLLRHYAQVVIPDAAVRTAVKFRTNKKMLLMDVCVAAGVPRAVLQQFQAAASGSGGTLSTCHALPWQQASSA